MSKYYIESNGIWKGKHQLSWAELCDELKQLEKEKDYWKSACAKSDNENVILKKELLDAVEQGYELSNSYNEYLEERKKDMLKHYSDKRRIQKRI